MHMRQRFVVEILEDEVTTPPIRSEESSSSFVSETEITVKSQDLPESRPKSEIQEKNQSSSLATAPPSFSRQSPAQDLFESRKDRVDSLLQEVQWQEAKQEQPHVEHPPLPKRKQKEQIKSAREMAFQQQLERVTIPKTKIEKFYQAQPEFKQQKQSEKKQQKRASSFPKKVFLAIFGRGALGALIATFLLLGAGVLGSAWAIRADLLNTRSQVDGLVSDLQTGQMRSARERVEILRRKQQRYSTIYSWGRGVLPVFIGEQKTTHIDKLLEVSDSGLYVIENGLSTYDLLQTGYQQFLGEDSGDSIETLTQVSGELEAVFTDLSALQAELQQLDNPFGFTVIDDLKQEVNASFPDMRRAVLAAQQMSFALPELLGENGKKQYLVLLQNNEELRPTGGFIGSFAILTVEKGRFIDFRVEDVYEADGQLQGYVTPPPEIVEHLGEAQWFLRDVNWSPDFPTVADQAGWFLNKEVNVQPDGVIGINLHVAQKLLAVTGPIQLVDYDEVITKDNLYERAEMHSEINFFPGSTQKRDFLSAVANQLFDKLMQSDTNTLAVMKALYESAEESELLIAVDSPQATTALQNLSWTGALLTPQCPAPFDEDCFVDTVMQVEANVGVNKANQYIDRTIHDAVILGKEQIKHEREMVFINRADSNAWPEGAYKNYLRLFVPENASLQTVAIDGAILDASSVRETTSNGKRSFGFLVNVPIKSEVTVRVEYTVPIPVEKRSVYALFEQKQPGTSDDKVIHSVEVLGRDVLAVAPEPVIEGRVMQFYSDRVKHQFIAVDVE